MGKNIRLFIGLPLPVEYRAILESLVKEARPMVTSRCSWVRRGNWHVTLKFLGDVEVGRVDEVKTALGSVDFKSFALGMGRSGFFPNPRKPRVLWLGLDTGADECAKLAANVDRAMAGTGFEPEKRPFRSHVTLARIKSLAPGDDWRAVGGALDGRSWPEVEADRFTLWQSVLGPGGPKYRVLGEFLGN